MTFLCRISLVLALSLTWMTAAGCGYVYQRPATETPPTAPIASSTPKIDLLPFGNPSGATPDPANKENYLIVRGSVVTSYNDSRGTANCRVANAAW